MGSAGKFLVGAAAAVVLLGQCGGSGVEGKAKAAAGGAAVGAAGGAAVGFGAGAGAAGAASGIKGGVKSRVEGGIKTAGRPNGTARPFNPGGKTNNVLDSPRLEGVLTPADTGAVVAR